jgi:hypothetical protein
MPKAVQMKCMLRFPEVVGIVITCRLPAEASVAAGSRGTPTTLPSSVMNIIFHEAWHATTGTLDADSEAHTSCGTVVGGGTAHFTISLCSFLIEICLCGGGSATSTVVCTA